MITFNTWKEVEEHFNTLPQNISIVAEGTEDFKKQLNQKFFDWVEKNYIDTPTFTVKEQDSTDRSDAYDRSNHHQS